MSREYRLFYPALPVVAEHAPHRLVYVGDADGRCQILAWDRRSDTLTQVTDRDTGTIRAALDPDGETVWWFDDDLAGVGVWRTRDFPDGSAADRPAHGVVSAPALPGVEPARHAGIAMAADGTALVGLADDDGMTLHRRSPSGRVTEVTRIAGYAYLVDLDPTGRLAAVGTDPAAPDAVTVLAVPGSPDGDTEAVGQVAGGPDRRIWALGFAPSGNRGGGGNGSGGGNGGNGNGGNGNGGGEPRLLLVVESDGRYCPATWTRDDGLTVHEWCWFDTEITASWYPDGRRILIRQDRYARTILHEADLTSRTSVVSPTPAGSVLDAAVWPDGDVVYIWTDSVTPPQLRSARGVRLPDGGAELDAAAVAPVDDYQRQELWVAGPGGRIHVLLATPNDGRATHPAVFLVHGGPSQHARDAYDPLVEVLVSTGCAVVRVNYRGSSGYGSAWRNDFSDGVGLTQVADLAAVREQLVAAGTIEAGRVALWGTSWGGYLTLLALGVQPQLWRLGVAINPIADYVAAFQAASPAVQALDVLLFGGTPGQVPQAYARSSPASYVDQVRAPVLLAVSSDDVRCPPAPVERYAGLLAARRIPHQLVRRRAGHDDFDARSHLALMQTVLLFMQRHFDGVQEEGTPVALAMARPVG